MSKRAAEASASSSSKRLKSEDEAADNSSNEDSEEGDHDQGENKSGRSICRLGEDIIQWCIMVHLDAPSLARCRSVCKVWKMLSSADLLWLPLCCTLFTRKSQLPLDLLNLEQPPNHVPPMSLLGLVMSDSRKSWLVSTDMCARTWEIEVKPCCGQYWHSLDPSTRGEPALVRFFHCDGSLTAGPSDPIWGGQESCWKFVFAETEQYIKINYWPMFNILRLDDGRWRLENNWATYTTQPDLHLGTGLLICKDLAQPCSGCSYPRLQNAVSKLVCSDNSLINRIGRHPHPLNSRLLLE